MLSISFVTSELRWQIEQKHLFHPDDPPKCQTRKGFLQNEQITQRQKDGKGYNLDSFGN